MFHEAARPQLLLTAKLFRMNLASQATADLQTLQPSDSTDNSQYRHKQQKWWKNLNEFGIFDGRHDSNSHFIHCLLFK